MELSTKPDFGRAAILWDAFWQGTNKRPIISITIPKAGVTPVDPPEYLSGFNCDYELVADKLEAWVETHEFIGEAIPYFMLEFGPDNFAALLGANLIYRPEEKTSWCIPFVNDWDDTEIKFRRDGEWWQRFVEYAKVIKKRLDGKLLIAPASINANIDVLAGIRGAENLMIDMITRPDKVKHALDRVCDAHTKLLEAYAELFEFNTYGCINHEGFYISDGRQSRPQSDVSCMISNEMFRELVKPALLREAADVDAMVYHLDGPGAIKHLEALCEIKRLDVISWVPGAGNEHLDWTWLYEKIIKLGKGYKRTIFDHEKIKHICRKTTSRKMSFISSASTKTEAEEFIYEIEKIYE